MLTKEDLEHIFEEVTAIFVKYNVRVDEGIALLLGMAAEASDTIYKTCPPPVYALILEVWDKTRKMLPTVQQDRNQGVGIA